MKRILLVILLFFPFFLLAQDNRKFSIEADYGVLFSTQYRDNSQDNNFVGINLMYNLNNTFYIGLGAQYTQIKNFYSLVSNDPWANPVYERRQRFFMNDFPLYAYFRFNISSCNWQPFINFKIGYTFTNYPENTIAKDTYYDTDWKENHGLMFSPKIGVEYRIKNIVGVYATIGMRFQRVRYNNYVIDDVYHQNWVVGYSSREILVYPEKSDIISYMKTIELSCGIRF